MADADAESCFVDLFEYLVDGARAALGSLQVPAPPWRDRLETSLHSLADYLTSDISIARVLLVEPAMGERGSGGGARWCVSGWPLPCG